MLCNCTYFTNTDQKKTVGGEFLPEIYTNWTEIPRGRWLAESLYRRSRILRGFSFSTVCYGADSVSAQFPTTQIQYLHSRLLRSFSFSKVCNGAVSIFTQSATALIQFQQSFLWRRFDLHSQLLRRFSLSAQFPPTKNQYLDLHSRLLRRFSLAHSSTAHIQNRRSRLFCWFSFIAAVVLNLILDHLNEI